MKAKFNADEVFSFQVIQRYYVQYLSGYDAVALNQCIQNLHNLTDDESILLSSIWQSISHLTVEQVEDPEHTFDFRYPPYISNPSFDFNAVCLQKDNERALCDLFRIGILCQCAPQQLEFSHQNLATPHSPNLFLKGPTDPHES